MTEVAPVPRPAGTCTDTTCPVATGNGTCIRGHANLLDCDAFQLDANSAVDGGPGAPEEVPAGSPETVVEQVVRLDSGEALTAPEASVTLARERTSVVVPLGHADVGKTTLFSVLYEQAAANRLSDWTLASSRSVIGFERRCHDASVRSGRAQPVTPHTPRDPDDLLLHLELRRKDTGERHQLLLADISGEDVEQLGRGDTPQGIRIILRRADRVLVLVDGRGLAESGSKENEIRRAFDLLRILTDQQLLPVDVPVDIVVSKSDLFGGDDADASAALERIMSAARERFANVSGLMVAARPSIDSPLKQGHGFDQFVATLTVRRPPSMASTWPDEGPLVGWSMGPLVTQFWTRSRQK